MPNLPTIPSLAAVGIFILSLIQIAPIKVNPWSWLGREIGKAIGIEALSKRIDSLEVKIDKIDRKNAKTRTRVVREKIITFASKLRSGQAMTDSQFQEAGRMIDEYKKVTKDYNLANSFCEGEINYILQQSRERGITNELENLD